MNQMTMGIAKAHVAAPFMGKPRKAAVLKPRFYRFYIIDDHGRIISGEDLECASDEKAIDCGWDMLSFGDYPRIEVWVRDARIGIVQTAPTKSRRSILC
jgi:hypothetical protein